jgi:hypothetical protein
MLFIGEYGLFQREISGSVSGMGEGPCGTLARSRRQATLTLQKGVGCATLTMQIHFLENRSPYPPQIDEVCPGRRMY